MVKVDLSLRVAPHKIATFTRAGPGSAQGESAMSLVNFLRFRRDIGAVISDEEYWDIRFRRRMYGDNLHNLLTSAQADTWQIEAVYGGTGYPSLHLDAVAGARKTLACWFEAGGERPKRVADIARVVFDELQKAIRARIDQKLCFYYGFTTDDLYRGYYGDGQGKVPIRNKNVRDAAMALVKGNSKDPLLQAVLETKAVVAGHDPEYGMTAYHLSAEKSILGYVHEGFEAIGPGKYASGMVFGRHFNSRPFDMRIDGLPTGEGLLELILSALRAKDHFKEVGGTFNIVLINGQQQGHAARYSEILDARARLMAEIVRAYDAQLLEREAAAALLEDIAVNNSPLPKVEADLAGAVFDPVALEFLLRGYKTAELAAIAAAFRTEETGGEVTDDLN